MATHSLAERMAETRRRDEIACQMAPDSTCAQIADVLKEGPGVTKSRLRRLGIKAVPAGSTPAYIEHFRKLAESKRGVPLSEEHKAKISASQPGRRGGRARDALRAENRARKAVIRADKAKAAYAAKLAKAEARKVAKPAKAPRVRAAKVVPVPAPVVAKPAVLPVAVTTKLDAKLNAFLNPAIRCISCREPFAKHWRSTIKCLSCFRGRRA